MLCDQIVLTLSTAISSALATTPYCDNANGLAGSGSANQFVSGCCKSDADCQSGCCSFLKGQCVGAVAAKENGPDGGCGFGGSAPGNGITSSSNGVIPTAVGSNSTAALSTSDVSDSSASSSNGTAKFMAKWRREERWTTRISAHPTNINN